MKIMIEKHAATGKYLAYKEEIPDVNGVGETMAHAIGVMVLRWPNHFGVSFDAESPREESVIDLAVHLSGVRRVG
jgi:hypothetical protein